MSSPDSGSAGLAEEVELDLLLTGAQAAAVRVLASSLDLDSGLAVIRAHGVPGGVSRAPPARTGPAGASAADPDGEDSTHQPR